MPTVHGWNPDWMFRKAINILNPGASVLTGFQVEVSLDGSFDLNETKQMTAAMSGSRQKMVFP